MDTEETALARYIREKIAALGELKEGTVTARRKAELQGEIGELRVLAMKERVNRHAWPAGVGSRCDICGATRNSMSDAGTDFSCVWRDLDMLRPPRRSAAVNDFDTIGARLAELQADAKKRYTDPE